jgi:DNA topoisomerase-3
MEVADKLYNKGLISYPRTETNFFQANIDLMEIIKNLASAKGK